MAFVLFSSLVDMYSMGSNSAFHIESESGEFGPNEKPVIEQGILPEWLPFLQGLYVAADYGEYNDLGAATVWAALVKYGDFETGEGLYAVSYVAHPQGQGPEGVRIVALYDGGLGSHEFSDPLSGPVPEQLKLLMADGEWCGPSSGSEA